MRLVLIHGWALDPSMWDALALKLEAPCLRVDLGFFGAPALPELQSGDILIGHSLGFLWGLKHFDHWGGAVAINGFGRFLRDGDGDDGCVAASQLRAMRRAVTQDAEAAVQNFRQNLGLATLPKPAQKTRLMEGLDFLRDATLTLPLETPLLTLAARDDFLVPPAESARLGGAATHWLDGGHGLPWTAPDFCAREIANFMRARNV